MAEVEEPISDISSRLQTLNINPHCNLSKVSLQDIKLDTETYSSVTSGLQNSCSGLGYSLMNDYSGCQYASQYASSSAPQYDIYATNNATYHGHVYDYDCSNVESSTVNSRQPHDIHTNNAMYFSQIYHYPQNEYLQSSCGNGQAFLNQTQSSLPLSTSVGNSLARGFPPHNQSVDVNYIGQANPLTSFRSTVSSHQHSIPINHSLGHTSSRGTKVAATNLGMSELSRDIQSYPRAAYESVSRVDSSLTSRSSMNASKVAETKLKANLDARRQRRVTSSYAGQTKEREVSVHKHILFGSNHGFNEMKNNHTFRQSPTLPFLESSLTDARFFIIKSYSEDNVYKSIKFNVWASTVCGNKKLDEAFEEAQVRAKDKAQGCPIFLFFSVNGSRQFCGIAEMVGSVDYTRSMPFWEQHKWNGSFPVKWHVIKDLPNSQLRHIILENNECKPVTNSRDGQEVQFQLGLEMLSIFQNYPAKSSIMDEYCSQSNSLDKGAAMIGQAEMPSPRSFSKVPEADAPCKDKQLESRPIINEASKWRRIGKLIDVVEDVDGKALEATP